jgi:hypothetical protein
MRDPGGKFDQNDPIFHLCSEIMDERNHEKPGNSGVGAGQTHFTPLFLMVIYDEYMLITLKNVLSLPILKFYL